MSLSSWNSHFPCVRCFSDLPWGGGGFKFICDALHQNIKTGNKLHRSILVFYIPYHLFGFLADFQTFQTGGGEWNSNSYVMHSIKTGNKLHRSILFFHIPYHLLGFLADFQTFSPKKVLHFLQPAIFKTKGIGNFKD